MNEDNKSYSVALVSVRKKNNVKKMIVMACSLAVVALAVFTAYAKKAEPNTNYEIVEAAVIDNALANESVNDVITISAPKYDVVEIVKSVSQSVVSINVTSPNKNSPYETENSNGSGSGVVVSEDDEKIYIVTNYHVIQDTDTITVSVDDDKEVSAHYIGSNPQFDLAVISVMKMDLRNAGIVDYSIATLGNSDEVEVGEYVIAIGNALGEGKTVTDGIISAKNKIISIRDIKLSVLQTNAAINQGNSGGPLSDMNGEIIGINTAKLSKTGVEGMGYSIPINDAKAVIESILQNPREKTPNAETPQLGVKSITVTYEMMNQYRFPSQGVYVVEALENSSAEKAGLMRGDIIVGFESVKITTVEELAAEIQKCSSGDMVKIYMYREGSSTPLRIDVTI